MRQGLATAATLSMLAVVSCGRAGPTKQDIAAAIEEAGRAQAAQMAQLAQMTGQRSARPEVASVQVSEADCTAKENDVFHCNATVHANGSTVTHDLDIKKVEGKWTLID